MEVRLKNVRHGKGNRTKFIYASLYEAKTDELLISATLDYILEAVKYRGYVLTE